MEAVEPHNTSSHGNNCQLVSGENDTGVSLEERLDNLMIARDNARKLIDHLEMDGLEESVLRLGDEVELAENMLAGEVDIVHLDWYHVRHDDDIVITLGEDQ